MEELRSCQAHIYSVIDKNNINKDLVFTYILKLKNFLIVAQTLDFNDILKSNVILMLNDEISTFSKFLE